MADTVNDALGMIETRGFAAMVEAADAMVKSGKYSYVSNSNYIPVTDY